jgi:AcrR family transcriptional regulator
VEKSHVRQPKQTRSRQSFDRVVDAACEIINEGGLAALTLAEVSRRSKVSIGSIYCRVEGKEDLLREVQVRTLQRMEHDFSLLLARIRRRNLSLKDLVPALVRELGEHHRKFSALLAAFMQQATADEVIRDVGRARYLSTGADFRAILLEHREEIRHPDPDHAVEACFAIAYGAIARYLGLGSMGVREVRWNELLRDLGLMTLAFLVADLRHLAAPESKPAR